MINRDAASETRTHDSTGKHTDALIRSATATPIQILHFTCGSSLGEAVISSGEAVGFSPNFDVHPSYFFKYMMSSSPRMTNVSECLAKKSRNSLTC